MHPNDLRPLHVVALQGADAFVRRVTSADLDRLTPCAPWSVGDLLAHMIGQHHGFAVAVTDGDASVAAYSACPFGLAEWAASVDMLSAAFAAADLEACVHQVELRPDPLPVSFLVAAQLLDTVVHTWDLARSLGEDHEPPDDVVDVVLTIAEAIPASASEGDHAAFGALVVANGVLNGGAWARALGRLGRDIGFDARPRL